MRTGRDPDVATAAVDATATFIGSTFLGRRIILPHESILPRSRWVAVKLDHPRLLETYNHNSYNKENKVFEFAKSQRKSFKEAEAKLVPEVAKL